MSMIYLYIFLQSNLLEVPFYYLLFRKNTRFSKVLFLTTAINSLTHPIVFFIIMNMENSYLTNILLAETFAVVIEALFFYFVLRLTVKRALLGSLIANLVSWQFAPMITYFILK